MTTPPTPPTDNQAAEGGPRSEMSEQDAAWWPAIATLAAEHWSFDIDDEMRHWVCDCGHVIGDRYTADLDAAQQAHLADALADLLAARDRRVRDVLDEYFDFDVDPWDDHDAACPAPEDVWRLHRDLRAIFNPEETHP